QPTGATVMVDGQRRGSTPLAVTVSHGVHTLLLNQPDAIEEQQQISVLAGATINVRMWLRRPTATLLKPAYPGATIPAAAFLEEGRLALSMAVKARSTKTRERAPRGAWMYDRKSGGLAQLAPQAPNPQAAEVPISPDGLHLAYLQADTAGLSPRPSEVWVASA